MNFVEAFRERVELQPGVPALIDRTLVGDRLLSYSGLNRLVEMLSLRLREADIAPGDLFLLLLEPSQEFYAHFLAALQIGAVPVIYESGLSLRRILAWVQHARPVACAMARMQAADPRLAAGLRPVQKKIYLEPTRARRLRVGRASAVEMLPEDAPALLLLEHDRHGRLVVWRWTQRQLGNSVETLVSTLRLKAGDIDLCSTPLHLLANLRAGLTSLIPIGFGLLARARLQRQLEKFKPTRTTALVTELAFLLRKESSPLHRIFVLNAPLSDDDQRLLTEHSAHATVEILFGDVVPVATRALEPVAGPGTARCVGNFLDQVEARTVGIPDSTSMAATTDQQPFSGELVVRAAYLPTPCTLQGEADRSRLFVEDAGDPWLRTGWSGYLDPDQRFWALSPVAGPVGTDP
ncbi:MAG: acyl--CoA ligase [Verrucomicrobia bacterium]|nr:acyl--CoA ligase [Verrucomicrobiota bacterium]